MVHNFRSSCNKIVHDYYNTEGRSSVMFVHNLATQASLLQEKHCNPTHEIQSGAAFMCGIVMLL